MMNAEDKFYKRVVALEAAFKSGFAAAQAGSLEEHKFIAQQIMRHSEWVGLTAPIDRRVASALALAFHCGRVYGGTE